MNSPCFFTAGCSLSLHWQLRLALRRHPHRNLTPITSRRGYFVTRSGSHCLTQHLLPCLLLLLPVGPRLRHRVLTMDQSGFVTVTWAKSHFHHNLLLVLFSFILPHSYQVVSGLEQGVVAEDLPFRRSFLLLAS